MCVLQNRLVQFKDWGKAKMYKMIRNKLFVNGNTKRRHIEKMLNPLDMSEIC